MPGPASSPSRRGNCSMLRPPGASSRSLTGNNRSFMVTPNTSPATPRATLKSAGDGAPACSGEPRPAPAHRAAPRQTQTLATWRGGMQHAPGVDDRRMAVGFPRSRVLAALPGRQQVALGLDGSGANQYLPVRRASHRRKGRWRADQFGAALTQRRIQLREAQVVTDGQTQAADRCLRHHQMLAGIEVRRLTIAAPGITDIDIEQVELVIARHPLAVGVNQQRAGTRLGSGPVIRWQRQGTGNDPQAQLARRSAQPGQDRAVALRLQPPQSGQVGMPHGGEVLGQHRQSRTLGGGLLQQTARTAQVGRHIGAADHLDNGKVHGFSPSASRVRCGAH